MIKTSILAGLLFLCISCQRNNNSGGTFSGTLKNIEDGTTLILMDLDSAKIYSIIQVQDGKFNLNFNLSEPRFFGLAGADQKHLKNKRMFWLENANIKIKGNYDNLIKARITGSESNKVYEVYSSIEKKYKDNQAALNNDKIKNNRNMEDSSLIRANTQIINQYRTELKEFYSTYCQNMVAFFFLSNEIIKYESPLLKTDFAQLFPILPENFRYSIKGDLIKEYISLPETPKVGDRFIDCIQTNYDGSTDSISSNLGKYTILEFWASNCPPCRGEHQELRKLFNLYHDQGLNIIGISGDNDLNDWKDAIKKDSVTWTNISDLRGWNNKAFMIYGIKSIPTLILLDNNGIIIDNTLRRKYLPEELKKLFNN